MRYYGCVAGMTGRSHVANYTAAIERKILIASATADYARILQLASALVDGSSLRQSRRARRWIAFSMLELDRVQEAIQFTAAFCVGDVDGAAMMPLPECCLLVDKRLRKAMAGELALSIALDLYTKLHDARYASERAYAYEDFPTAHGVDRASQLRHAINSLDTRLLVYYLRYVCVQDIMQLSTAFSSPRELDEERLAVCALLVEIDPLHLDAYEEEIRGATRKLVVRRGIREVEQSKIYIDMSALRRWADKNLKESFTRYIALVGAGLDVGGPDRPAARCFHGRDQIGTEFRVPIKDQEALRLVVALPSFVQLQRNPKGVGIASHVVVKDSTPVMADHEEAVQNPEGQCRHREKVHGCDGLAMVPQKRQPALRWIRRSRGSLHPS